jgi:hypothetical protein
MSALELRCKIARLNAFIGTLQDALGWQIEIEKEARDEHEYTVELRFSLVFRGKVWGDILRDYSYQRTVFAMVKHRLYEVWDRELASCNGKKG